MNRGNIDRIWNGEYVVTYNYVTQKGQNITQEFPMHPYYAKFEWTIGTNVIFQYAMECEEHYPYNCSCTNMTLFALPLQVREQQSLLNKLKTKLKKWLNSLKQIVKR